MFVSSYATFIQTNSTNKNILPKENAFKREVFSLSEKASGEPAFAVRNEKSLPIDYVSNYKSFQNQQKLQEQLQGRNTFEEREFYTLTNAKNAYEESAKKFSLAKKPAVALSLTPKIDTAMPQDAKEAKIKTLRQAMVETYIANDRYYYIRAA